MLRSSAKQKCLLISLVVVLFFSLFAMCKISNVRAEISNNVFSNDINLLAKEYTDSEYLYGDDKNVIYDYEKYIDKQFEIDNLYNKNKNIYDEWIFKIVPKVLFENKVQNYLYIGKKYGFYINYSESEDNYFVYILKHIFSDNGSGKIKSRIEPLYYEKYYYNEIEGKVQIKYAEKIISGGEHSHIQNFYQKYSTTKKVYLKDISFTGAFYNENSLNVGENGYSAERDRGAFFVGNNYKFNGVENKANEKGFQVDKLYLGVDCNYESKKLGSSVDIDDYKKYINNINENSKKEYNGILLNESNYQVKLDNNYKISLPKISGTFIETKNTNNAILIGVNGGYAENTYFYDYRDRKDKANSRFVSQISMDIVEEGGSKVGETVKNIANDVKTQQDFVYTLDVLEKTNLELDSRASLYLLNDSKHRVEFVAKENGSYTFNTIGNVKNHIMADIGSVSNIDDYNQQLVVNMKKGQKVNFYVQKDNYSSSASIGIYVKFTPNNINLNEKTSLIIAPNQREFVMFNSIVYGGINFEVLSNNMVTMDIYEGNLQSHKYNIKGENLTGSIMLDKNIYYIGICNNSNEEISVALAIKSLDILKPSQELNTNIFDKRVIEVNSDYITGVKFTIKSEASTKMDLVDSKNKLIASSVDNKLVASLKYSEKYYLIIDNYNNKLCDIKLSLDYSPKELKLGNNHIDNVEKNYLMVFENKDIFASYNVKSNIGIVVYNNNFEEVKSNGDGIYLFKNNEKYFIVASENVDSCEISIDLAYTDKLEGNLSNEGFKFIRYVPQKTAIYVVKGVQKYTWYNEDLTMINSNLYESKTYYLKIEGQPNQAYNISISMNTRELVLDRVNNVYSGYYSINILENGYYDIKTFPTNNVEVLFSLYNIDNNIVSNDNGLLENVNASVNATMVYLEKGTYYLDININNKDTLVGIKINNHIN